MTEVNYYLAMIIMLQFGKYGALFPDIDHSWQNVKEKTVPNMIVNKLIHLTGGKHRSWQTHSIDIALVVTVISFTLPDILLKNGLITEVNMEVLGLVLVGFSLGWLSHLFSDMLTSAGVRVLCYSKKKVALVPKELFGIRFNTGHDWENWVYKVTRVLNVFIGIISILYVVPSTGIFGKLTYLIK
jgi:membrane-bound metal-dependent hydrolase YbcI (DUF457 family)